METTQPMLGNGRANVVAFPDDDSKALSKDIIIDPPIEFSDGRVYETMHLQEPTGQQMELAEVELAPGVNVLTLRRYQFAIVSQVSGIPTGVIKKMRMSQIDEASNFLQRFTRAGQTTGENG